MSTPIESNTEELQEILQTVYNLPNAGGGTPDLVLSFAPNSYLSEDSVIPANFSVKSGSVQSTYTKLLNRERVNVILEHEYFYGNSIYTGVWYPVQVCAEDYYNGNSEQEAHYVCLIFCTDYVPGYSYPSRVSLLLELDGTVTRAEYDYIGQ